MKTKFKNKDGTIKILEYPHPLAEITQTDSIITVCDISEAKMIKKSMKKFIKAWKKPKKK